MAYPPASAQGNDPMHDEYMDEDFLEGPVLDCGEFNFSDQHLPQQSFLGQDFPNADFASVTTNRPVLSKEEQKTHMQSIVDVFELSEEDEPENEGDDDVPMTVDFEAQYRRTEKLGGVRSALDKLWWSNSEYLAGAAEKLADGSRDPRWRIPMGDSGILNSFLVIAATPGVPHPLMIHVLRLIGNACADRDENRERVVSQNYIPVIISLLKDMSLLPFAIPVLFNICIEYEPAQRQASESYLSKALMEVLLNPAFGENKSFVSYICKLLDMMATQPGEMDRAPYNMSTVLTNTALESELQVDMEDFLSLATCAIAYLKDPKSQQTLVKTGGLNHILRFLFFSYSRFEDINSPADADSSDEDAKALTIVRSSINQVLSDISALPDFAATYPVTSPFTSNLRRWLSSQRLQLQVCACIMLGNIARSDAACEEFVYKSQIHKPLLEILTTANDSQILHAALGFLKNLALPAPNKTALGDANIITILPRLWQMETLPQIQYSSISLMRQLVIGNFENIRRLCIHLSDDPDSPAWERSRLSILIAIFKRTDAEPIKMEIARLITAICRVFTSPNQSLEHNESRRKTFFDRHPDIGRPISFMVSQTKWPVVRSEGWFVMALMARTPEGAICVSDIMHDIGVFQPLVELLTGKGLVDATSQTWITTPSSSSSSPTGSNSLQAGSPSASEGISSVSVPEVNDKAAMMQRIDRENALVLVSELLKQRGSSMASIRRSVFEDLLKGGGTMHLSYAQVKEREDFYDGKMGLGPDAGGSSAAGGDREKITRPASHSINDIVEHTVDQLMG